MSLSNKKLTENDCRIRMSRKDELRKPEQQYRDEVVPDFLTW